MNCPIIRESIDAAPRRRGGLPGPTLPVDLVRGARAQTAGTVYYKTLTRRSGETDHHPSWNGAVLTDGNEAARTPSYSPQRDIDPAPGNRQKRQGTIQIRAFPQDGEKFCRNAAGN